MHDLSHWHERWATGEIGWHVHEPHPLLTEHAGAAWQRVLVPLCGASLDLGWLADRGCEVVGVEISMIAAERVFAERGVEPSREEADGFALLSAGLLTVAVGDMFAFNPSVAGGFDAVWDRASLVAIPIERRGDYAAVLRGAAPGAQMLLTVFDYDRALMDGPPHAVTPAEVEDLFAGADLVAEDDLSEQFAQRGRQGQFTRRLYRARL